MPYNQYIETNPNVMMGKPVVKHTRITVELIMKKLGEGATIDDLILGYPSLKKEEVLAALQYAAALVANEEILIV
jgi:uncharacterized protein (DUF433 family)